MSRSGYSDDCKYSMLWMKAVDRAIQGKRGQAFLRALIESLDAMPEKKLIRESLVDEGGGVCAMGAVGCARGIDMSEVEPDDAQAVAQLFNIAPAMAREIAYENDEGWWDRGPRKPGQYEETPEGRWQRMRDWAAKQLMEWTELPEVPEGAQ